MISERSERPFLLKEVAILYGYSYSTLNDMLFEHREKLKKISTQYKKKGGKVIYARKLNDKQLEYIVKALGNPPDYTFDGKKFKKD